MPHFWSNERPRVNSIRRSKRLLPGMTVSSASSIADPGPRITSFTSGSSSNVAKLALNQSSNNKMFLIDDLLLSPLTGLKFILGQIEKIVDRELNDETVIKEQLLELQMRLELEEISEDEYETAEAELFARLRAIKERQLEMLGQIHTSDTSSMTVEMGGDDASDSW